MNSTMIYEILAFTSITFLYGFVKHWWRNRRYNKEAKPYIERFKLLYDKFIQKGDLEGALDLIYRTRGVVDKVVGLHMISAGAGNKISALLESFEDITLHRIEEKKRWKN